MVRWSHDTLFTQGAWFASSLFQEEKREHRSLGARIASAVPLSYLLLELVFTLTLRSLPVEARFPITYSFNTTYN